MRVDLRYGCNPHQGQAAAELPANGPIKVRAGQPSLINLLDALNAWQLVRELREVLELPAAASFKHVSPAGAAVAVPLPPALRQAYEIGNRELSPLATAYARARGTDPKSSFGDFVALSDPVDTATANYLRGVVSDGIVAPAYEEGAFATLAAKKNGTFVVVEADPEYQPPTLERREVFGLALTQERNNRRIRSDDLRLATGTLPPTAVRDLLLALATAKYTQSNAVVYATDGQTIGVGAGQQSRVDCTKLAGAKADVWHLGRHPQVLGLRFQPAIKRQDRINWRVRYIEGDLTPTEAASLSVALAAPQWEWFAPSREAASPLTTPPAPLPDAERTRWRQQLSDVALASDGFIPFRDNIDHAHQHGVRYIAQPGGSVRDDEVEAACQEHGVAMAYTGLRLFHH